MTTTLPGGYTPDIWDYSRSDPASLTSFGDETTYKLGFAWLYAECQAIQDWGAGVAYARRFVPSGKKYFAVDGSPTSVRFVDEVCELTQWHPDPLPEGIFMRHILEHNPFNWKDILAHALESFTKRYCLVIFTPFSTGETHPLRVGGDPYWDLAFNYHELTEQFGNRNWHAQSLPTGTQYGQETVFYIEAKHT